MNELVQQTQVNSTKEKQIQGFDQLEQLILNKFVILIWVLVMVIKLTAFVINYLIIQNIFNYRLKANMYEEIEQDVTQRLWLFILALTIEQIYSLFFIFYNMINSTQELGFNEQEEII